MKSLLIFIIFSFCFAPLSFSQKDGATIRLNSKAINNKKNKNIQISVISYGDTVVLKKEDENTFLVPTSLSVYQDTSRSVNLLIENSKYLVFAIIKKADLMNGFCGLNINFGKHGCVFLKYQIGAGYNLYVINHGYIRKKKK